MEDSAEFKTVKRCTVPLETALKGLDRNMVDFLYQNGFITDDACDQVLSAKSSSSVADKVYELVKGIKNRVKQDKESYLVLVNWLSQGDVLYQPIVNTLAEEYQRQLVPEQAISSVPVSVPNRQHQQATECKGIHLEILDCIHSNSLQGWIWREGVDLCLSGLCVHLARLSQPA